MPNPTFLGYLDEGYLETPYASGTGLHAFGFQVQRVVDSSKATAFQVARTIADNPAYTAFQVQRVIEDDSSTAWQVSRQTSVDHFEAFQVQRVVEDQRDVAFQVDRIIESSKFTGFQVGRQILDFPAYLGLQVARQIIDFPLASGFQVRRDASFPHWACEELGYLYTDYLTYPYLSQGFCVFGPWQVQRTVADFPKATGFQVQRVVDDVKDMAWEVARQVTDYPSYTGWQVDRLLSLKLGFQVRRVLYNTTNLRVMCDFPSRGTSGLNWTATSTATGDFSINNVNTDIVEQQWRSNPGTTSATITSDTEIVQGIPVDTIAILNHNLTTSATVTVEASNSPTFSPVGDSYNMTVEETNMYYLAPLFPTTQYRYWRFIISDPTNPDSQLKIGTILFGTTIILQGECFVDEVTKRTKHFSDKVMTEGFTNVSNDRAIKNAISLEFRNIGYTGGNYSNLRDVFEFARTSLKCLWIPDPQDVQRFATFGKIVQIPDELHRNLGADASNLVNFTLEVDESL
jgi:hypothetical protein